MTNPFFTPLSTFSSWSLALFIGVLKSDNQDFSGSPMVKNPPANAEDMGLIPGQGRSHMPQSN